MLKACQADALSFFIFFCAIYVYILVFLTHNDVR